MLREEGIYIMMGPSNNRGDTVPTLPRPLNITINYVEAYLPEKNKLLSYLRLSPAASSSFFAIRDLLVFVPVVQKISSFTSVILRSLKVRFRVFQKYFPRRETTLFRVFFFFHDYFQSVLPPTAFSSYLWFRYYFS